MRFLLSPKWVIGHVMILVLGITFVALGFWQLDRLEQRRLANAVNSARLAAEPSPLGDLLEAVGEDVDTLEFRRTTATGVFVPEEEVLVRSQVLDGRAGFHVITPLRTNRGDVVLVNRGWVPLEFDNPPVAAAAPPAGETTVTGLVRLSRSRAASGRDDFADGGAVVISRVDIAGLDTQISGELLPVYIEAQRESGPTELPVPVEPPDLSEEGPHLEYAFQWFGFALIAVLGYGFLIRRALRRRQP
jgi:surfeit locus 1 family protein